MTDTLACARAWSSEGLDAFSQAPIEHPRHEKRNLLYVLISQSSKLPGRFLEMPSRSRSPTPVGSPSRSPLRNRSVSRGRSHSHSRSPPLRRSYSDRSRSPRRSITPRSYSRSRSQSRTPVRSPSPRRNGRRGHTPRSRSRSPTPRGRPRSYSRSPSRRSSSPPPRSAKVLKPIFYACPRVFKRPALSCNDCSLSQIVVEQLTKNVNEGHLREIFGKYGPIRDLKLPINPVCTCLPQLKASGLS